MLDLSQQDYVRRIDELNSALIIAWDQDQRVKSLKIAIQVQQIKIGIYISLWLLIQFLQKWNKFCFLLLW